MKRGSCCFGIEGMTKLRSLGIACIFAAASGATAATQEVPAGWSVEAKGKGAILTYAPEADGPRYLIVACLRETDEIGVYSTGIGAPSSKPVTVLQLTNGGRKYSLRGDMGQDNISHQPAFRY